MNRGPLVRLEVKPAYPLTRREYVFVLQRLLEFLGLSGREVELSVTDDSRIARLNERFMKVCGPTNVLSFPGHEETFGGDSFLGSVCLSADAVRRESLLYGQDPCEHAVFLLAHAVLHLAEYDHGPSMEDLTEEATAHVLREFDQT